MRRPPARKPPEYVTVGAIQRGPHYATHIDQPIRREPLAHVSDAEMDVQLHACDPATARGVPSTVNYKDGVIRVWPWPAEGWQVWSEIAERNVTP